MQAYARPPCLPLQLIEVLLGRAFALPPPHPPPLPLLLPLFSPALLLHPTFFCPYLPPLFLPPLQLIEVSLDQACALPLYPPYFDSCFPPSSSAPCS